MSNDDETTIRLDCPHCGKKVMEMHIDAATRAELKTPRLLMLNPKDLDQVMVNKGARAGAQMALKRRKRGRPRVFDLSVFLPATRRRLGQLKIKSWEELAALSWLDLVRAPRLGRVNVQRARAVLLSLGLDFKEPPPYAVPAPYRWRS